MSAANPLHPQRYLHTIHAALECQRLRGLYCHAFGGLVFSENYYAPEDRDATLLYVADHMIEIMAPGDATNLDFMFARYLQKAGPSYHSISFKVADCDAAHRRCKEKNILINTTGPGLIYLHPKSTGGIIVELTHKHMPNDPWDAPNWRPDWAVGRPNVAQGLAHIVCAPRNPDFAIAFLVEAFDGVAQAPVELSWPQPARATPVKVADVTLLVLDPVDRAAGPLVDFRNGPNAGVYALAWRVADGDASAAWFEKWGIEAARLKDAGPYSHEVKLDGVLHWFCPPT